MGINKTGIQINVIAPIFYNANFMIQKYFILIVAGLLMSVVTFSQTSWYVSKTGSDSNQGTIDSPLLTVQAALNKMNTADVLYIREGIYRELVEAKKNKIKILAYPG